MKKLNLLGFLIAVAFSSCVQDIEPPQEPLNLDPHHISVEQAIQNMNSAMSQLYIGTRTAKGYSVQTLKGRDLQQAGTRSDGTILPEDVLYIVNFDNDEGFAVLAADDRIPPVVAMTEEGVMSLEVFTELNTEPNLNESLGQQQFIANLIKPVLIGALLDIELPVDSFDIQEAPSDDYPWIVSPLLTTRWNQTKPFNANYPPFNWSTETDINTMHNYGGKYAAGCGPVAVAQLIAYHEKPAITTFGITNSLVSWQSVKNYNYGSYSNQYTIWNVTSPTLSKNGTLIQEAIAKIMYELCSDLDGIYKNNGTVGIDYDDAVYCPRQWYSYVVAGYNDYRTSDILYELGIGHPVLMYGADANRSVGHMWIIDGIKYSMTMEGFFPVLSRAVHCNWGWGGACNGYFTSGIFNLYEKRGVTQYDLERLYRDLWFDLYLTPIFVYP